MSPAPTISVVRQITFDLPRWAAPFMAPARWKSMRGGRGSAKSHTAAQLMIMRMAGLLPAYPKAPVRIASCRDFNTNLDVSVKVAVEKYIKQRGLEDEFDIQNLRIVHRDGSIMTFHGVSRNPDSFLSMEDYDVFWMEQAEVLQEEMIKIEPTIRKPGSELLFVWNPNRRQDYCWQRFVANPEPDDVSALVNWHDNPWWTPELEEGRLRAKRNEPSLYPWIYLGVPNDGDATHQVLPYAVLQKCVEAFNVYWPQREQIWARSPHRDAGFDIAEGGADSCSVVCRAGPFVLTRDNWPGVAGDLNPAALRAVEQNAKPHDTWRLYYDGSVSMRAPLLNLDPPFTVRGVLFGGEVEGKETVYERGRTNKDMFRMRNIQMGDGLRLRANRTVRLMNGDTSVDPADCLFINPELYHLEAFLAELTGPIRRLSPQTGRWELDKRGGDQNAESPDDFDGLCLAYARDSETGLVAR